VENATTVRAKETADFAKNEAELVGTSHFGYPAQQEKERKSQGFQNKDQLYVMSHRKTYRRPNAEGETEANSGGHVIPAVPCDSAAYSRTVKVNLQNCIHDVDSLMTLSIQADSFWVSGHRWMLVPA